MPTQYYRKLLDSVTGVQSLTLLPTTEQHLVDKHCQVDIRGSTGQRHPRGHLLPLRRATPHLPPFLPLHGLPYRGGHVAPLHLAADLHPDAPLRALVPAVRLLLREERLAQHRHATKPGMTVSHHLTPLPCRRLLDPVNAVDRHRTT